MYKSMIAIAAAGSFSLFAGPLAASGDTRGAAGAGPGSNETDTAAEMGQTGGQAGPVAVNPTFERLDTDNDGSLSQEELSEYGTPSAGPSEWQTMRAEDRAQEMMDMVDKDGDGSVSPQELEQSELIGDDSGAVVD